MTMQEMATAVHTICHQDFILNNRYLAWCASAAIAARRTLFAFYSETLPDFVKLAEASVASACAPRRRTNSTPRS